MNIWLNIILFQMGWFACVLGGAYGYPAAGALCALLIVLIHVYKARHPLAETKLILVAALLGLAADTVLIQGGWLAFDSGILIAGMSPYWMVTLWMLFAVTLNVSMSWLKPRRFLGAILGAVGGPLAYYAGAKLGALAFAGDRVEALVAVGVVWALAMPLLLVVAERGDSRSRRQMDGIRCV